MPYLKPQDKKRVEDIVCRFAMADLQTPGELNYLFTEIILRYLRIHGENYLKFNDCVGALECAKLELYRRRISLYEDTKIKTNGDVY